MNTTMATYFITVTIEDYQFICLLKNFRDGRWKIDICDVCTSKNQHMMILYNNIMMILYDNNIISSFVNTHT